MLLLLLLLLLLALLLTPRRRRRGSVAAVGAAGPRPQRQRLLLECAAPRADQRPVPHVLQLQRALPVHLRGRAVSQPQVKSIYGSLL